MNKERILKIVRRISGEMAQPLKALDDLAEDPGSILSTHMEAQNHCSSKRS